jgi:23S rRNA pseudouridine1911/1915/1917 synthase
VGAAEGPLELGVEARSAGVRLDQFLVQHAPQLTRSLIDDGQVQVNGAVAKPARKLREGDRVRLQVPAPRPTRAEAEDLPFTVLYEDRELLALDKPAGMVVHPAAGHFTGTLVNALLHRVKDLQGIGGELRPGLVHRLDRETSGCMVVAKSEVALTGLQASFKRREVEKRYLAIVHGAPPPAGSWVTARLPSASLLVKRLRSRGWRPYAVSQLPAGGGAPWTMAR